MKGQWAVPVLTSILILASIVSVTIVFAVPQPVEPEHFKCYEAEGDAVNVLVNLVDQFGVEQVLVGEPELFCNPVDKNGEGILVPTAHLTCYEIEDEEFDERNVDISNQLDDQTLEVEDPELLCVQSEKIAVDEAPEDDNDKDDE